MCLPNLNTAPIGHLIKIRTFLKKDRFLLQNQEFVWRFKGLALGTNILKFGADIQQNTTFPTINLK